MAQPFELKFIVDLADALGQVKSFAEGMAVVTDAVAKVGSVGQEAAVGLDTLATATAAGAQVMEAMVEAVGAVTAAESAEAAELARLTDLLGSEEMARASMNAQIIDNTVAQERASVATAAAAEVVQSATASTRAYNDELSRSAVAAMAGAEAEEVLVAKVEKLPPAFTAAQQAAMRTQQATKEGFAAFTSQTQEWGQMLTMLGLVDPQLLRVGVGVQMLGQAAETLGPKIVAAGGGLTGFLEVLGPIVAVGAAVAGVFAAVGGAAAAAGASIKAAIPEQEAETSFAILLGNVEKAKERLEELDQTALKFHLDPGELRTASEQLTRLSQGALGAGQSMDTVIEVSARSGKSLSEVGAIIGRMYETIQSGQPIGRMATQLVRMGALSASDVNELNNLHKEGAKGPQVWAAAEEALNRYSGAAEARAHTFTGATKGISSAWDLMKEAIGRPIVDALTPFLQKVADFMAWLVPYVRVAGQAIGAALLGIVSNLDVVALAMTGNFAGAISLMISRLVSANPLVAAACDLIGSTVNAAFAALDVALIGMAQSVLNTLVGIFQKALEATTSFVKSMGGILGGLPGVVLRAGGDAALSEGKEMLDGLKGQMETNRKFVQEESDKDTAAAVASAKRMAAALKEAQPAAPNAGTQFKPLAQGEIVEPDGKSPVAKRTKEVNEGKEAEKEYKDALEATKGLLESGQLSQADATQRDVKTTQDYITHLKELQATLSPTSEQYMHMTAQIDMAQASLLKLAEGQEEYQAALALTRSRLEANIITQAQSDAEDNKTISDYIERLRALQAAVSPTSEKFQEFTTKINEAQAALQKTTALGQITAKFHKVVSEWGDLGKNASEWLSTSMNSGISTVSQGLTGLITKTGDWRQAFVGAIDQMLESLIELGVKEVVHFALTGSLMSAQAALGISTTSTVTAAQVASGAAIAAAHAPAAAATSVSSYGVAAVVGAVLAIAAIGAIIALLSGGFAEGGLIPGAPSHSDNRIAKVATGEYVIRTAAVQHWGPEFFDALNSFRLPPIQMPAYAAGGLVGGGMAMMLASGGSRDRGRIVNNVDVGSPRVTLIQPNTRSEMHAAMRSAEGDTIIIDAVNRNKHRMPFKR